LFLGRLLTHAGRSVKSSRFNIGLPTRNIQSLFGSSSTALRSWDPFSSVCSRGRDFTQNEAYSTFDAETTNGPDQGFDWLVQSYDLDLNSSDKFYLWLFEGGPSVQGNTSIKNSQSSGFFYISAASIPTNSSSPSTTSGDPKATSDVSQNKSSAAGGELSPGAKAGIGVGAGVAGLAILSAILLFAKYRSKKKKEVEQLRSANYLNYGGPTSSDMSKPVLLSTTVAQQPPSELLANHDRVVAELG
jgi:hypothetical protein